MSANLPIVIRSWLIMASLLTTPVCSVARAQQSPPPTSAGAAEQVNQDRRSTSAVDHGALTPVVAGAEGEPSRVSLLDPRIDLAIGRDFSAVYSVNNTGRFARVQGGLYAVFDRGVYARWAGRDIALVPPGTVYSIGDPDISRNYWAAARDTRINRDAATGVDEDPSARVKPVATAPITFSETWQPRAQVRPRLVTDPAYRASRTRALLGASPS